jgi:hypothetical protein
MGREGWGSKHRDRLIEPPGQGEKSKSTLAIDFEIL